MRHVRRTDGVSLLMTMIDQGDERSIPVKVKKVKKHKPMPRHALPRKPWYKR